MRWKHVFLMMLLRDLLSVSGARTREPERKKGLQKIWKPLILWSGKWDSGTSNSAWEANKSI